MNKIIHSLLKKKWTDQDIQNMVGSYKKAFKGYAIDERIRFGSASGGVSTAVLSYALDMGFIDGALVCRSRITDDRRVRTEFFIARNREELLLSQDSKYVLTRFAAEALPQIEAFDGKLAVVGLPCDLTLLNRKVQKNPQLAEKVQFTVGLFCGHNSQEQLIDNVVEKLRSQGDCNLDAFRFRIGLWRGFSLARFDGGKIVEKKSAFFNLYQNLYFLCQKKCLYCHDHFAYDADISVGDIWSYHLKDLNIKYNAIICKNDRGARVLSVACDAGYIHLEDSDIYEVFDGQSRVAPTHNNTSAKSRAGIRFGMRILDRHNKKVKWHEYWAAWIILFNYKWSMNQRYAGYIFKVPRRVLKAYLLVLKGLESLK